MNRRRIGTRYEQIAAEYLRGQGYQIICTNYRCRMGEIDLICRDGRYLVFVEVKYRANDSAGSGFMAVDARKQHRISRVAAFYLLQQHLPEETPCRFDVVSIDAGEISLLKNAFDYCW